MVSNQELGARGEAFAALYLVENGFEIVDRNWRSRAGELDIVAREGNTLAFVEVKTRSGVGFGTPAEAVTATKQLRIRKLAMEWLAVRGGHWVPVRFDVVAILLTRDGDPVITHIREAF